MRTLTLSLAAIAVTMVAALHAEEPPGGWFNESHVTGIHDMTVLLGSPYEFEPLCSALEPVSERGQIPISFQRPCAPKDEWRARYDRELWARDLRRLLGDPGRH